MTLGFLDSAFIAVRTKLGMTVESVLEGGRDAMEDGGSFSGVSSKVDDIGGGAYHLLRKGGVYTLLIVTGVSFLALALSKAHNREDAKSKIIWLVLGGVGFFGSIAVVIALETIGTGLFETAAEE